MTVIGFPATEKKEWVKPKTLEDWPWEKDLGKPHMDINAPLDSRPQTGGDLGISPAASICHEAASLLDGERARQHGDKLALHRTMAALFSAYLDRPTSPTEAAMLEALMKVARTKHGLLNKDDYRDGAAYFGIAWEIADAGC